MRPVFLVVAARMLRRTDHFSSVAMFRKLFNSSKPEMVTAKPTGLGIRSASNGLVPDGVPVTGTDALASSELRILRDGFRENKCFTEAPGIECGWAYSKL